MYTTHIENGEDEIKIDIEYDYQPYEPMERHYPGCDEQVDITEITLADTNAEICIIDKDLIAYLETEILEDIAEEADYAKYGYMMEG